MKSFLENVFLADVYKKKKKKHAIPFTYFFIYIHD